MADQRGVPDLQQFTDSAESYYRLHVEAVRQQDFGQRVAASWGLIARGHESLPYLMSMLRSRDKDSREDAGGALGWLGEDDRGVVAQLVDALDAESDDEARDSIVLTLGELKNRSAVPALARLIRAENTDGDTRRCAVESLGKIVRKRFDKNPDPEAAAIDWLDGHSH